MKILHLVSQDNGGAGRAAIRLHQALLDQGIDSQLVVQTKTSDLPTVHTLAQSKFQKLLAPFRQAFDQLPTLFYKNRSKDTFSSTFLPKNKKLLKKIREINPDIIHLHWIGSGFINIFDLEQINRPILWSLHDANPFTGGCHVAYHGCDKYKTSCNTCPFLGSNFKYDLSYFNFKRKQKAYKKLDLTINGLSRWITNEAKSSTLFKNKNVINLPNPIDTKIFRPIDKNTARNILGLTTKKILLGFGAVSATQIPRKGYSQLIEALELLPDKHRYKLVVFGSSHGKEIAGIETVFLGHLYDDVILTILYSLLDITVIPSLSESFGQVALESLACGTPVVCFKTSGLQDIVKHQHNGYLADSFVPKQLTKGILWLASLSVQKKIEIQKNAIETAKKFDSSKISQQYLSQYKTLLCDINKKLGGGDNKVILGFGAVSATQIPRKGYPQLIEALELLPDKHRYKLVVFGSSHGKEIAGIETVFLGHLYDDVSLALFYNSLDLFITPSLAENLSNTIMESLACETPVIAFDIGGNSDMIQHKQNGFLAKDTQELAKGVTWCLNNLAQLSLNARSTILKKFDYNIVAQRYIDIYTKLHSLKREHNDKTNT